jgi:hypothetical protein
MDVSGGVVLAGAEVSSGMLGLVAVAPGVTEVPSAVLQPIEAISKRPMKTMVPRPDSTNLIKFLSFAKDSFAQIEFMNIMV